MAIRAKFICKSVDRSHWGNNPDGKGRFGETVTMEPVMDGSPENKAFWEASPSGKLQMTISNPAAHGQLIPGVEYYLDFTEAPKA